MTPERLQEIRVRLNDGGIVDELLDYIDLLHEDLRITRQERDHAKHQALEHRLHAAALERERDEYRRGQGRAPAERGQA